MRPIIYPYKMGSQSARALAESLRDLRAKRVRPNGNYRSYRNHMLINWGNPSDPSFNYFNHCLNHPDHVVVAQNKLTSLMALRGEGVTNIPDFAIERSEAEQWLSEGYLVVCRELLRGSGGRGITLASDPSELISAPLYTKYIKKAKEYRVHVFQGEVIHVQEKRKRRDIPKEEVNFKIRNHDNGWVFCMEDVVVPDVCRQLAIASVAALRLDFGAVDIIWNKRHDRYYTLEVNTAPGLEGTTLERYSNAIRRLCE